MLKRDDRDNSIFAIDDDHFVADHEVAVAAPLPRVNGAPMTRAVLGTAMPALMEKLTLLTVVPSL